LHVMRSSLDMRNSLMLLLAELDKAGRFVMIVREYGSYCAYNLTLDPIWTCAVLPLNAASTPRRCNRAHRLAQ